jgi:hypothetical protein
MFDTYKRLGAEREAELLRTAERANMPRPSRSSASLARLFSHARRLVAPIRVRSARLRPTRETR